ncbi:hypothetical protein EVAR_48487_1 [Eumeta japonica]|uniref:Uncharacterized protein n=1 Tax=Eumeta variegata TaxID=151549 RepID=A0A4C1XIJ6_EUMVA|nr:hypothetical protein EVAR_48487_1 [Eumeta japonica]
MGNLRHTERTVVRGRRVCVGADNPRPVPSQRGEEVRGLRHRTLCGRTLLLEGDSTDTTTSQQLLNGSRNAPVLQHKSRPICGRKRPSDSITDSEIHLTPARDRPFTAPIIVESHARRRRPRSRTQYASLAARIAFQLRSQSNRCGEPHYELY